MSLMREVVDEFHKAAAPKPDGIVLALGGGGAAGLAHVGVLQVLAENNIPVRAIAGTSIGAQVGAFYAAGLPLDDIVKIAITFDWKQTVGLFLPDLPIGGFVSGIRVMQFLRARLGERLIEDLGVGFVAVTSDLESGEQVVLDRGDLVEAVRASVAMPGLLAPYRLGWRLLVDGGVLNPLPFDVARQYFGGPVIAVAVHAGGTGLQKPPPRSRQLGTMAYQLLNRPWTARAPRLREWLRTRIELRRARRRKRGSWTTRRVLDRALDISQQEIVRLRAERQPPDIMLTPFMSDVGTLKFYRAEEAIAAGRMVAEENLAEIKKLVGMTV
jgi:NTE family protein